MKRDCTIYVAKTKALKLITAKLICAFVLAYAKHWFSHDTAQLMCCFAYTCITIVMYVVAFYKITFQYRDQTCFSVH